MSGSDNSSSSSSESVEGYGVQNEAVNQLIGTTDDTDDDEHTANVQQPKGDKIQTPEASPSPSAAQESPTRDSPTRDSPTRDSPTRDSPTRDSPTRDSPTRDSPTRDSPTRDSPVAAEEQTEEAGSPKSDDSDEGGLTMKSVKRAVVASDSDDNDEEVGEEKEAEPEAVVMSQKDLFGDDADLSSTDEEKEKETVATNLEEEVEKKSEDDEDDDGIHGIRMHMPEEDEAAEQPPAETVIQVEVPRIQADLGNSLHFVKFPNFLSVEPRPFDQDTYEDEIDEDEVLDEEGRSRLKLKVENTIRWRHAVDAEGNPTKESNAKIVRWSDGTMSCYLGSEIFDVHVQPTAGDYNHLFVRQGAGLQGQAVFRTKLTFRPHSTDTMTHRKMTLSMADRTNKAQKVKVLAEVGKNPEKEKEELVRREEERLRASARRESQQRRIREKALGRGGMSRDILENDEYSEEDETSLNAIKKSYKPGGHNFFGQGIKDLTTADSADDSDSGNRLERAKKLSSDDEEGSSAVAPKKRKLIEEDEDD